MNGPAVASGMGTCGFVGPIGVYAGWLSDVAKGAKAGVAVSDRLSLIFICFLLPALLTPLFAAPLRKMCWIKDTDLKLDL